MTMSLTPEQWDTLLGAQTPAYDIPSNIQTTAPVATQAQQDYQQAISVAMTPAFDWAPPAPVNYQNLEAQFNPTGDPGYDPMVAVREYAANVEANPPTGYFDPAGFTAQAGGQDFGDYGAFMPERLGELSPAWREQLSQEQVLPYTPPEALRYSVPGLNTAGQAIAGLNTPADLIGDPTTPYERFRPTVDPFDRLQAAAMDAGGFLGRQGAYGLAEVAGAIPSRLGGGERSEQYIRENVAPVTETAGREIARYLVPEHPVLIGLNYAPVGGLSVLDDIGAVAQLGRGVLRIGGKEGLQALPETVAKAAPREGVGTARAGSIVSRGTMADSIDLAEQAVTSQKLQRGTLGRVISAFDRPREVLVANKAREIILNNANDWVDDLVANERRFQQAFDEAKDSLEYVGGSKTKEVGTAAGYLDAPWDYAFKPTSEADVRGRLLEVARAARDNAYEANRVRLETDFGIQQAPFFRVVNGVKNSYVPHLPALTAKELDDLPRYYQASFGKEAFQKRRSYPGLAEALAGGQDLELGLESIARLHGLQQAEAAATETYLKRIGAKNLTELATDPQIGIPGLLKKRDTLAGAVSRLKAAAQKAGYHADWENRLAGKMSTRASNVEKKLLDLQQRVTDLGTDYGPELSHLSGELYQVARWLRSVDKDVLIAVSEAGTQGAKQAISLKQVDNLANQLADIRNAISGWRPEGWTRDPQLNRWLPDGVAAHSQAILHQTRSPVLTALGEMRSIQLNTGDFSPITFGRAVMGLASQPSMVFKLPSVFVAAAHEPELFWRAADQDLLRIFQGLRSAPVTRPLAEVRPENIKGLERLTEVGGGKLGAPARAVGRGVRATNEMTNRIVTMGQYLAWQADVEMELARLAARNVPANMNEIGARVWRAQSRFAPLLDLSTTGLSKTQQELLNAPLTSLSYLLALPRLAGADAAALTRLSKAVAANKGSPQAAWRALNIEDRLVLERSLKMAGVISTLSATSVMMNGGTKEQALAAMSPFSEDGWTFQTPFGNIPLAGPLRSGLRFGQRLTEGDFNAAINYMNNRLISGPAFLMHMLRNQDFGGERITSGPIGEWSAKDLGNALLYGMESATIVGSDPIRLLRQGEPLDKRNLGRLGVEMVSNLLGSSVEQGNPLEKSSTETLNRAVSEGALPEYLRDKTWLDLTSRERQALKNYAEQNGDKALISDIEANERRLLRKDTPSAKKRAEVAEFWQSHDSELDSLLDALKTGKVDAAAVKETVFALKDRASNLYEDDAEYQKYIKSLPSTDIYKLLDAYYSIGDQVKAANNGVYDKAKVEMVQKAALDGLRNKDPELAARLEFNLQSQPKSETHPLIDAYEQASPVLDTYYNQPEGKAREEWRAANPKYDYLLWLLGYVSTVRSQQAADMARQTTSREVILR